MATVARVAAAVVGVVFVIAGASKLAAGPGWRTQARDLGAPDWSIAPMPWVELVVGAALAVGLAEPFPALAAIVLLVGFTALLVARIREGRRPACACFGAWSASPIGATHLARNAVLLVAASVSLAG